MFPLSPVDKSSSDQEGQALTTCEISRPAEAVEIVPASFTHLKDVKFPEIFPRSEVPIDVLIGLDFYYSFVTRDIRCSHPVRVGFMWASEH